ncbi:hypothetical protein HGRIS_008039 [Hohenbuehelia grisea]|uniref:Glycosyltransferase family 32 protein n=1 Tax=Hohenbuehelia grisea TaxID=104357 RepID=A0ABR3J6Q6_9AGAR
MSSSAFLPTSRKQNGFRDSYNSLPTYSSAVEEKRHRQGSSSWTTPIYIPLPGVRTRRLRIPFPNARMIHQFSVSRFGHKRGPAMLLVGLLVILWTLVAFTQRIGTHEKEWRKAFPGPPSTLVFHRADLQHIWKWEIASGHYPSRQRLPVGLGLTASVENPALPAPRAELPSRFKPPGNVQTRSKGIGPRRTYLNVHSKPPDVAYPPRPVSGSIADLDVVMEHCDFSLNKYVRDCLEVLRVGAGLDNGKRLRRGTMDNWKYIYSEKVNSSYVPPTINIHDETHTMQISVDSDPDNGLTKKRGAEWDGQVVLPHPLKYQPYKTLPEPCDENHPRLFHMFWTGPFTDKPYLALLSFLFTQHTGIHLEENKELSGVCKPKFWLWINPGPAAAVPNPSAVHDMYAQLKSNPWASPFLHPRFKGVIEFKLWNTTEQLDGVAELKHEWRSRDLFNSGGHVISVPSSKQSSSVTAASATGNGTVGHNPGPTGSEKADSDDVLNRTGSKSSSSYDRLSVILSDMARFILCHRFGGIYLDADTIFLRDWEELWGWKGAFAYRWSRLEKYNTAVLRLNKQSALGKFLFRTALKNNLDFHPMTVSRYMKDAHLEPLLLRLPDALFDPAWLNVEDYQRDRPAQPFFTDFANLFDTPAVGSAAPQALGFEGFFRGSFSYHFHNFWWKPFDPARNWPDLGERFKAGEMIARASAAAGNSTASADVSVNTGEERVEDDRRDLDWATVLKRTFESYIRGERPNMYGEWIQW